MYQLVGRLVGRKGPRLGAVPNPGHACRLIAPRRLFNHRELAIVAQRANLELAHTIMQFHAFQAHRLVLSGKLRQGYCFPQAFKVLVEGVSCVKAGRNKDVGLTEVNQKQMEKARSEVSFPPQKSEKKKR